MVAGCSRDEPSRETTSTDQARAEEVAETTETATAPAQEEGPSISVAGSTTERTDPSEPPPADADPVALLTAENSWERPVAEVNGEMITFKDVEIRLRDIHSDLDWIRRGDFDIDRLMFRMVNDWLLSQEARVLEMDQDEKTRRQVEKYRRDLMVEVFELNEIKSKATATEAEIRSEFKKEYQRVNLRVITVDENEQAGEILASIQGGADMAELAGEHSVDPYAPRGGLVSDLPKWELIREIGQLVPDMEPGEIGGPVRTDLGWSVIRLESVTKADPDLFPKVEKEIHDLVIFEKSRVLRARLAGRVREKHPVRLDSGLIESIRPERFDDGRIAPTVDDRDAVVARIGSDLEISADRYAAALLLRWSGVRSMEAAEAAAPIILEKMIEESLILAEAMAMGYGDRPEVVRAVYGYETRILVQRFLEEVVAAGVEIPKERMEEFYQANKDSFSKPPRLRLGQITVATREEAEEIAELLREGTDLAWLARQRSIDRLAETGGDLGWKTPQPAADDLNRRLVDAQPGEIIDPQGVPGNFVVQMVLARQEQGHYTLKEVSGNVRNAVFAEKFRVVLDQYVTRLREASEIVIYEEMLDPFRQLESSS
jgi:peptidyl-prolyl cis-trans isomerase C